MVNIILFLFISISLSPLLPSLGFDYNELRTEAAVHARLRSEAFQKAAEAKGKKQGDLAVFYAQQVSGCVVMLHVHKL